MGVSNNLLAMSNTTMIQFTFACVIIKTLSDNDSKSVSEVVQKAMQLKLQMPESAHETQEAAKLHTI